MLVSELDKQLSVGALNDTETLIASRLEEKTAINKPVLRLFTPLHTTKQVWSQMLALISFLRIWCVKPMLRGHASSQTSLFLLHRLMIVKTRCISSCSNDSFSQSIYQMTRVSSISKPLFWSRRVSHYQERRIDLSIQSLIITRYE
jgi:hypothetical protein